MAIALVVHQFLFQAFYIPSGSMENTLHVGDRVLVNRLSYKVGHVQRGQIVVFNGLDSWTPEVTVTPPSNPAARVLRDVGSFLGFAPSGEQDFIKRVIGVPGDHVTCCDVQGRITVNSKALDENYLSSGAEPDPHATTTQVNAGIPFDITVPPGQLWVEGDHRHGLPCPMLRVRIGHQPSARSVAVRGSGAPIFTHAVRSAICWIGKLCRLSAAFADRDRCKNRLDEKTLVRIARHNGRTGFTALEHAITRVQQQAALHLLRFRAVTFVAIVRQHRTHLALKEIDLRFRRLGSDGASDTQQRDQRRTPM